MIPSRQIQKCYYTDIYIYIYLNNKKAWVGRERNSQKAWEGEGSKESSFNSFTIITAIVCVCVKRHNTRSQTGNSWLFYRYRYRI